MPTVLPSYSLANRRQRQPGAAGPSNVSEANNAPAAASMNRNEHEQNGAEVSFCSAPTGLRPKAQGCPEGYLGSSFAEHPQPQRGCMRLAMVGMARRAVRVVADGTDIRATLACEGVAPPLAARASQPDDATSKLQTVPPAVTVPLCGGDRTLRGCYPGLELCWLRR